jgi:hypothetical protein
VAEVPPEPVLFIRSGKIVNARVAPAGGDAEQRHLRFYALKQRVQRLFAHQVAAFAQPVGHHAVGVDGLQQHQAALFQLNNYRQGLAVPAHSF